MQKNPPTSHNSEIREKKRKEKKEQKGKKKIKKMEERGNEDRESQKPGGGSSVMKCLSCFSSSSSSSPSSLPRDCPLPNGFFCPISGRLIADPAIIMPTGHIVELACFQACMDLNYIPSFLSSSSSSSSSSKPPRELSSLSFFPFNSLKSTIVFWCDSIGRCPPHPISQQEARSIVQRLKEGGGIRVQEPTAGESSQSRTACQPADDGQPSSSASAAAADASNPAADDEDSFEEKILKNLMNPEFSVQKFALCSLIQQAESSAERAISLCSPEIMGAVLPLLLSDESTIQTKASKVIMVLSQARTVRIKIVDCGAIPPLLFALYYGIWPTRTNAATTLCNLAKEETNWKEMGKLGVIPTLLEKFYDDFNMSYVARKMVAVALFNLTHLPVNLSILANMRAVPKLLTMAADRSSNETTALRKYSVNLLCALSGVRQGREDLIREAAVVSMLQLAKEGGAMSKHCVGLLFNLRTDFRAEFRSQALAGDGIAVLALMKDDWEEDGKEMAKTMLKDLMKKDKEQK